jgi:hypothetical protein
VPINYTEEITSIQNGTTGMSMVYIYAEKKGLQITNEPVV